MGAADPSLIMTRPFQHLLCVATLSLFLSGCLSLGGPALEPRYFAIGESSSATPEGPDHPVTLVLGEQRSAAHLRDRIAWSDGATEVGFFEDLRWVEPPADSVGRHLRRAFRQLDAEPDSTVFRVEIELFAFELERGDSPAALLELRADFRNSAGAYVESLDVEIRRELTDEDPKQLAAALGAALADASNAIIMRSASLR